MRLIGGQYNGRFVIFNLSSNSTNHLWERICKSPLSHWRYIYRFDIYDNFQIYYDQGLSSAEGNRSCWCWLAQLRALQASSCVTTRPEFLLHREFSVLSLFAFVFDSLPEYSRLCINVKTSALIKTGRILVHGDKVAAAYSTTCVVGNLLGVLQALKTVSYENLAPISSAYD